MATSNGRAWVSLTENLIEIVPLPNGRFQYRSSGMVSKNTYPTAPNAKSASLGLQSVDSDGKLTPLKSFKIS